MRHNHSFFQFIYRVTDFPWAKWFVVSLFVGGVLVMIFSDQPWVIRHLPAIKGYMK